MSGKCNPPFCAKKSKERNKGVSGTGNTKVQQAARPTPERAAEASEEVSVHNRDG